MVAFIKLSFLLYTIIVPTLVTSYVPSSLSSSSTKWCNNVHRPVMTRQQQQQQHTIINNKFSRYTFHTYMVDPVSSSTETTMENTITLQLTKPFGLILEEMDETTGGSSSSKGGVMVKDVVDSGSAKQYSNDIIGTQIIKINNMDVSTYTFDEIMVYIQEQLPMNDEPISIVFYKNPYIPLPIGTTVTITVLTTNNNNNNEPIIIKDAKVGNNLRQTLLENNIEIYQGIQKLSNCGGAGQCTLCAFDFISTDSNDSNNNRWGERSDYESSRLKKFPLARLTCLNTIQGPATIRKTPR